MSCRHVPRNALGRPYRTLAGTESELFHQPRVARYLPRFRVRSDTKKYCFPIWGGIPEFDSLEAFIILGLEKVQGKSLGHQEEPGNWLAFTKDYLQIDEVEILNRLPAGSEIILVKRVDAFIE